MIQPTSLYAVYFRFLDDSGNLTNWVGLAVAPSLRDLFWKIDEHGDPYQCLIQQVAYTSICVEVNCEESGEDDFEIDYLSVEPSDTISLYSNKELKAGLGKDWFQPKWPKNIKF